MTIVGIFKAPDKWAVVLLVVRTKSQFLIKRVKQFQEYSIFDIEIKLPGKNKTKPTIIINIFLYTRTPVQLRPDE